ncbi:MAG: hypothetical protein VYD87_00615 [Pseudomonadota bacterium]|nr:hypothetical protein [Pseudomonadota bacterium]
MRRAMLALLLLAAAPAVAHAGCAGETLAACEVAPGEVLHACVDPEAEAFSYAFGPPGAPDLTLRAPFAEGTARPWNGVGRAIWSRVAFRNGAYAYEVWISLDRLTPDPAPEAGMNVLRGETLLASLQCRAGPDGSGPPVIAPIFAIEDAMEAAGWRWEIEAGRWARP